jgi:hypothetical protein
MKKKEIDRNPFEPEPRPGSDSFPQATVPVVSQQLTMKVVMMKIIPMMKKPP